MPKKSIFLIISLFFLYFIFYSISYSYSVSNELEENIFRLHVIANSDSAEDQELKLYVRDKVIEYLNNYSFSSKSDTIAFLEQNQSELEEIVSSAIEEKGFSYSFSIEIENSYFPTKYYGNVSMPSGTYDCLKIKLGESAGQNWWCVLFPPMCLINETTCELTEDSVEVLENSLDAETMSVITPSTSSYVFKFKIIDIINSCNS